MTDILIESHSKGRSVYGLRAPHECIRCHVMTVLMVNSIHSEGNTTCLHCERKGRDE